MDRPVDPYRFIRGITKRMIKSWLSMEQPRAIPWTPLAKPLADCTVALLSSAGVALASQNRRTLGELLGDNRLLVIDEAQRVPEIGLNLKILVDNYPHAAIIATGSASFDLARYSGAAEVRCP